MLIRLLVACFFIIFFHIHVLIAQRVDINELKKIVSDATSPQGNVDALNDLFLAYIFIHRDSANKYREQAFRLATQSNYLKAIAYNKAFEGIMYKLAGTYTGASDNFLESLKLFEAIKDTSGIAFIYNEIGIISTEQGFFELAETYFNRSLQIRLKNKDEFGTSDCYYDLGNLELRRNNTEKALSYHQKALQIRQKVGTKIFPIAHSFRCMADVYRAKGDYKYAQIYAQEALNILKNKRDAFIYSEIYNVLGGIYYGQGDFSKALEMYQQALDSANKVGYKGKIQKVYLGIARCYSGLNLPAKSQLFYEKSLTLKDSLSFSNEVEKIMNMKAKEEIKEKQKEIIELQKNKEKQKEKLVYQNVLIFTFLIFFVVLGVLLYVLVQFNRRYRKTNYELAEKNKEVLTQSEEIEAQRDSLVKNNESFRQQNEQIKKQRNDLKKLAEYVGNYKDKIKIQRDALQVAYEKINGHRQQIKAQRNDLKRLIETITAYKDKIKAQRERLASLNEEIKSLNDYLEDKVKERTHELKNIIESLSKQNQDLEQFSYIISHNLRAPVARILGLVNIFDKENNNVKFNTQILGHLTKATEDLDVIIRDLTEVISIRNNLNMAKEQVNLEAVTSEACAYLESEVKKANAQIHTHFEAINIFSVKSYAQSIIYNLLSNAIKFRSNQRDLVFRIKTEYMEDYVCFSVRDNGIGMDLTNVDKYKVFGLYQRMHEHVEGKGMGLFLVKTQIEALNGKVEVESKYNEGSVFRVYFPMKDEEAGDLF